MAETEIMRLVGLPLGLGLSGFIEPCSIGSTLLFIKTLVWETGDSATSHAPATQKT